jgi:hypothetical protein
VIVDLDVAVDHLDQLLDAFEDASANPFSSDFTKPTLDQIQPGRTGGNKMQVKSFMPADPLLHLGMLVGAVVVDDQVKVHSFRRVSVHLPEKLENSSCR